MALPSTANTPRPRAHGYGARLNDRLLRLAAIPEQAITFRTAELEPPRVSTETSPEEIRTGFGNLFGRSTFYGGEGLDFAHRRDQPLNAPSRYWDSRHIDVTTDRPGTVEGIRLLEDTENIETSADSNLKTAYDGTALYMAEGTTVRRSTTFKDATPIFADDDPHAGQGAVTVEDLAALGEDIYAALNTSGIHKRDGGAGTWSELTAPGTFSATNVWSAKGFLLAANSDGVLVAINVGTGAISQTLVTLPDGEVWKDIADAGAAIMASASDGYLYALVDDESGGLQLGGQTFVGIGQEPCAVAARSGVVFYTTLEDTGGEVIARWWRGDLDADSGIVTNIELIRVFGEEGDGIDREPCAMTSTNDAIYLGVSESSATHIWRYDLAQRGRSRWWDSGVSGLVKDVLFVDGKAYWTIDAEGMYRVTTGTYEADGYLIGPLGDLFTATTKAWVGALLDVGDVDGGRVELYYATDPNAILDPDSDAWTLLRSVSDGSSSAGALEVRISNAESRFIAGMLRLVAPSGSASSPVARGFTFRAYPSNPEEIVEVQVDVSDRVSIPGRRRARARGLSEKVFSELMDLQGEYAELELFRPARTLRGVVESVTTPIPEAGGRHSGLWVCVVRFRGKTSEVTLGAESQTAFGGFGWGDAPFGSVAP